MNTPKLEKGFTLIEVLVALAIVSISVVSIFCAFIGISDSIARIDNYNKAVALGVEKIWELEEALINQDNVDFADFSGEIRESENRSMKWEITGKEIENYPNLTEINFSLQWTQGSRTGNFSAAAYLKVKEVPQ
jgi:prepilin-type N-terminal cleavage/methylation domain-containing protein